MNWPPMLVHIRVKNKNCNFGLWFPLCLVLLVGLIFFIAFLPLILLVILIAWPTGWGRWMVEAIKTGYNMLCAARGTKVDIQGRNEIVDISLV